MAHSGWLSIYEYLQPDNLFNERNFATIHEQYQQQCGGEFPETLDESAIAEVARRLKIQIETVDSREHLHGCVLCASLEDSRNLMKLTLAGQTIAKSTAKQPAEPVTLNEINCLLTVKAGLSRVTDFLRSFLLKPINEPSVNFNIDEKAFPLDVQCPLHLLVKEQLQVPSTRLRLLEPINSNDDYGPWQHDHWRGLFDLQLEPHDHNTPFPEQWSLAPDAKIHCRIASTTSNQTNSHSSHLHPPRTSNLKVFVQDVCAREGSKRSEAWLKELALEDIHSFEHLNSLTQAEWDRMNRLSMHARRMLKAAVEQARTSRQPETEDHKEKTADCELLANLHLIKLYICHKLRIQPALPMLEVKCLDLAFEEMKAAGFADDGLFPKIRDFFLPLTISEEELHLKRPGNPALRLARCEQLRAHIDALTREKNGRISDDRKLKEEADRIENLIKEHNDECSQAAAAWKSKNDKKKQAKQLEELQRKYVNSLKDHAHLLKARNQHKQKLEDNCKKINECTTEIERTETRLKMIEEELHAPHKPVDHNLVKPPRGLIMYGPPGTGKSEILKQLADKLGILMIGPPLAAGELNRSLVGESERIIVGLCSRARQVPYAMCCISIDEIDSLTPKRNQDSSEGKVDKISVLLSLIEGVKDVPNLMILSATNRLHMMDEAFLRRMSGKFFVGRPSSHARLTMLREIPPWALEPELLDRLVVATTNFSGAAVRALTKAMTGRCIERQRRDLHYQIGASEALKIAERIAQQYQIFIGSETLPSLLARNSCLDAQHPERYYLPDNLKYTGRIIVDLHGRNIRIEICSKEQASLVEYDLYSNESTVQTLLERLTNYGKDRNFQLLQLIDLNLLASQNAYDEKKVYETLKDRCDECGSYPRSMIVYDLDALIGVSKSESNSSTGPSMTSAIHNQSIYTYVLARFRDRVMEDGQKDSSETIERWTVAVIREPFLLRQFCMDAQYPQTREEKEEVVKQEKRQASGPPKCVKCKDFYSEEENRIGNCCHHDGFVFDTKAADLEICTPSRAAARLREIERKIAKYPARREELELLAKRFQWICCDETFTNVRTGGCKRGNHGFFPNGTEPSSTLNQAMIDEWEEFCLKSDEYNEKRLILLKEN